MESRRNTRIIRTDSKDLREIINNISSEPSDSDEVKDISLESEEDKTLKEVKTYYLFFKELDKKYNICISNLKPKEYFACVLCDEDKDFIMEFENYFKYNVDYIEIPKRLKYSNYRVHNLTKDKLKQEMDKFINKLGVGYYLDYFSTVKYWTSKD